MPTLDLEAIASACAIECVRQHVGLDRVADLIDGYHFATMNADRLPTEQMMLAMAGILEPDNHGRYRTVPVTFAGGGTAVTAQLVPDATRALFERLDTDTPAAEFTKAFLDVHPLLDGNGRTAFVLFNWLNKSLAKPAALPDFFGSAPHSYL